MKKISRQSGCEWISVMSHIFTSSVVECRRVLPDRSGFYSPRCVRSDSGDRNNPPFMPPLYFMDFKSMTSPCMTASPRCSSCPPLTIRHEHGKKRSFLVGGSDVRGFTGDCPSPRSVLSSPAAASSAEDGGSGCQTSSRFHNDTPRRS